MCCWCRAIWGATPKYSFSVEFRREASGVYRGVSMVAGAEVGYVWGITGTMGGLVAGLWI